MWRKQEEPKPTTPAMETGKAPKVEAPKAEPPKVEPPKAQPPVASQVVSAREVSPAGGHLSKALKIKGEISGREDIFIDGEVHGQIRIAEGRVTIGPSGRVVADVEAREVVVRGKLKGDLIARERVQIDSTGSVIGDVVTRRIAIDGGAELRGHVDTTGSEERGQVRAAPVASSPAEVRPEPMQEQEPAKEPLPTV
jgi:cytoskeletal protein CcmA (bactofilin family)